MKLIKLGRSYVIVIPKEIVKALKLEDKEFDIEIKDIRTLNLKVKLKDHK